MINNLIAAGANTARDVYGWGANQVAGVLNGQSPVISNVTGGGSPTTQDYLANATPDHSVQNDLQLAFNKMDMLFAQEQNKTMEQELRQLRETRQMDNLKHLGKMATDAGQICG